MERSRFAFWRWVLRIRFGRAWVSHKPCRRPRMSRGQLAMGGGGKYAMEEITDDRWITRQELADRYGVPVKTPAQWASKGTGPPYAKFGRHVRYRLRDVVA